MSEERPTTPTTPKITGDMPQSPPMLMRRKGQLQRLSNKDRFKIDIFDLHKSLSSDITGRITLDTILDFMNNNKSGSIDYLTKKLTYIEYIHQNINMFEDDFETFSQIIDLYESIENIKTAIKLFKSGITGVLRAGLDKKYYAKYLKYKKKYLALKKQLSK
jgi:hypothetical protein